MVEVLARDNVTGNFAGLQVKTATVSPTSGEAQIHVRKATLTHAASTWVVCLAWWQEIAEFDAECVLIPAADIASVGTDVGASIQILFNPKGPRRTRLDQYRRRLAELESLIVESCGAPRS
jgi:hypothetical protein